ncbi:MAG: hypothetical protein C0508_01305 [Cyanobacteria bacterium PR.023]|nr:hypothetical protein [Cyanobacteria bacterium PR.3.49]MBA4073645.1 hypothetical protein [Cyanobacteria bacterium PR.023]
MIFTGDKRNLQEKWLESLILAMAEKWRMFYRISTEQTGMHSDNLHNKSIVQSEMVWAMT